MYSQNSEEQFIVACAGGRRGRFLDVGAYDGKTFSNTMRLVELGWSGVCVEPDPLAFEQLKALHGSNHRVKLVNQAVAPEDGWLTFFSSGGDATSTSNLDHKKKWEGVCPYTELKVPSISVKTLMEAFPGEFQFLNLDVEGTNWELLQLFDLTKLGVKLACVEQDIHRAEITRYCAAAGLDRLVYSNSENLMFVNPQWEV